VFAGPAAAAHVVGDDVEALGQDGHDAVPDGVVVGVAVHRHDRGPGRIAVLEPGGAIDIVRADGSLVHRLVLPAGQALSAQLSGTQLVILTGKGLQGYDAATGAAAETVLLGPSSDRTLADFDQGIAVYVEGRTVHVHRLADGHKIAIALPGKGAVFAQLEPAGLFAGYTLRSGKRPGRVDFITSAELGRRLG